jgi:hypothetical protein
MSRCIGFGRPKEEANDWIELQSTVYFVLRERRQGTASLSIAFCKSIGVVWAIIYRPRCL